MTENSIARPNGSEAVKALLPWESEQSFNDLQDQLYREYQPQSGSENALVDRLVDIVWKRQRLRLAERSLHLSELQHQSSLSDGRVLSRRALVTTNHNKPKVSIEDALCVNSQDDEAHLTYYAEENADLDKAIAILEAGQTDAAVKAAMACLREDTVEWWDSVREDEEAAEEPSPLAEHLLRFLKRSVKPEVSKLKTGVEQRPAVRLQAWGQSVDPIRLARLIALNSELDRQFERNVGMLLKLQSMRLAP